MTATETHIRAGREADLPELVDLYNYYVHHSHATFDLEPKTLEQRRDWFDQFATIGPHRLLVAETSNRVVGYATSARFRNKPAYQTSVETTAYVRAEDLGRGIGTLLYQRLFDELEAFPDVHRAFAGVAVPNDGSIALHEKFGFELIGTFKDAGFKFGRYWSVTWFQKACR